MRRVNRMTKRLGFAFLLAAVCAAPAGESDLCLVEAVAYPGKDYYMWDGLYAARNGAVYTGLITEGITSSFYVYRPEERRNTLLFDLAAFLGERGKGVRTASKIHHRPVEDDEGNLYFVPMNNGAGPRSIDYTSWEGGHWMKFDPRSGRLEKMGLVDQGIGCYPLTLDPKRGYLFGVGFTGYFTGSISKRGSRGISGAWPTGTCAAIFFAMTAETSTAVFRSGASGSTTRRASKWLISRSGCPMIRPPSRPSSGIRCLTGPMTGGPSNGIRSVRSHTA